MCSWISFQGGKQAQAASDPCVGKLSSTFPKAHLQIDTSRGRDFAAESSSSKSNTPGQHKSSSTHPLLVPLPRGDVCLRSQRKKAAGSELEHATLPWLGEMGRRRSVRCCVLAEKQLHHHLMGTRVWWTDVEYEGFPLTATYSLKLALNR